MKLTINDLAVIEQYMVVFEGDIHMLVKTKYGWYKTTNGAFGQRDFYYEEISDKRAIDILHESVRLLKKQEMDSHFRENLPSQKIRKFNQQ